MDTQGYIESGYIKLPANADFINDFLVEMEAINPEFNTHDDQLDPMMDAISEMKGKPQLLVGKDSGW
jgi:predicted phage terminase large subunit-like protein